MTMISLGNVILKLIFFGQGLVFGEALFMNRLSVTQFLESPMMMASLDKPLVIENALEWRVLSILVEAHSNAIWQ
jgi:hypothetical protein